VFHDIPQTIAERMRYLECMDTKDREDGTPRHLRLRQIPPETGKFIAILAAAAPKGTFIEIGTSAGYSTLWLTLACRKVGNKITTFEWKAEKAELAEETFKSASVEAIVELIIGDARQYLENYKNVSFCFLDADKEAYQDCYEAVIPNIVSGGLLVADNVISHRVELQDVLDRALNDRRVDALIVPIGKGELVCRKI
jgi:caffeoyl-CoA O-methyltransferase